MKILALIAKQTAIDNNVALGVWLDDLAREGHVATQQSMPAGCSVGDVFEAISSKSADHVQLFGNLPVPVVVEDPDGHGRRGGACLAPYCAKTLKEWQPDTSGVFQSSYWPSNPVRSCSALNMAGMGSIGDEAKLFDRALAYNHTYRTGNGGYGSKAVIVDKLDQLINIRTTLFADLQGIVGGVQNVVDLSSETDYNFFSTQSGKSFLLGAFMDGGVARDGGIGLYNTGSVADFASGTVPVAVMLLYCSHGGEFDGWFLQRAALAGGAVAVLYDPWGSQTLAGWSGKAPISQFLLPFQSTGRNTVWCVVGDGTIGLVPQQEREVTEAEFQSALTSMTAEFNTKYTALSDRVSVLERAGSGGGGGNAVVILSAKYRQAAAPNVYKDCTAIVQALYNTGKPFYVYSETAPCLSDPSWGADPRDPYPRVLKELWVEYSKGGSKVPLVTFAQWAQVVF